MKKNLLTLLLLPILALTSYAQNIDLIAQRKVDSLKKLLPSTEGLQRVDLLNSIAQGLIYIWESDHQLFHEAMKYSDESMTLAKKLNYKRGIGYSWANLFFREANQVDTNSVENSKPGSHFQNSLAIAKKAINIGEELKDDRLVGQIHGQLSWLHRWKGKREDYITEIKSSIKYFEKTLNQPQRNIYTPLNLTDCEHCVGVEFGLGRLYSSLAGLEIVFKEETAQILRKAISYFNKANANSSAGSMHLVLARVLAQFNDIRTAVVEAKQSLPNFIKQNDEDGILDAYQTLSEFYYNLGDLENGLLYSRKGVQLAERLAASKGKFNELNYPGENEFYNQKRLFHSYYWAARFYTLAGDHQNASDYLSKASKNNFKGRWSNLWTFAMGNLHRSKGNYDSALFYLSNKTAKADVSLVRLYNEMHQYDSALIIFQNVVGIVTERNNLANLGRLHSYAAKSYYGKNDFSRALSYARKADNLFNTTSSNLERIDNYELLSDIYQQTGKFDSAYIFLKQYNSLRDSVLNKRFYIRLNDFKKEAEEDKRVGQIKLLQKDVLIKEHLLREQALLRQTSESQLALLSKDNLIKNQLLRLRDQQLLLKDQSLIEQQFLRQREVSAMALINKDNKLKDQQLSQQKFIRNALLGGLFLLFAVVLLVFRSIVLRQKNERLQYEKRQAELQQQSSELEMQALRAQMNPHFIFNCLSSINKFILKNESRAASDYLTRFSRLIRRVLTNSQLRMIPLSDEVEMLRLYLDMERLRFDHSFEYHIIYANAIEPETIYVPPMLLQPICENAIWHGLMHMEGQGKLDVVMKIEDDKLHCTITDNGIGRSKAAEINKHSSDKQQSFGLKITNDRIALFNDQEQTESFFRTEDVLDETGKIAGTKVRLVINYKDAVHELVKQIV